MRSQSRSDAALEPHTLIISSSGAAEPFADAARDERPAS
jgi:hypothetical protein